ncbi:glycosyltransferase family 4 protein [Pseudobacter ginsenosidimutans]|nr:glycosyltransferase family 4 protein [Pseudobacter ginsenosidimutans]
MGDKLYNSIGKKNRSSIPVIMGLDNPWKANFRQRIAVWLSPFFQQKFCSHLWVAGIWQYEYARRLGFSPARIIRGLYCADTSQIRNNRQNKTRRILYIGRLVNYKRPDWLLRAFIEIQRENPGLMDWKLTFIGNGPLHTDLQRNPSKNGQVEFLPFMQPTEIRKYYEEATVFCLPSHFEHWGVVVQEAAAAGLPLLLSDTCGAATEFLVDGWNGYQFRSQEFEDLKQKLLLLMNKEITELDEMGNASSKLSKRIDHDSWAASLKSVLVNYSNNG